MSILLHSRVQGICAKPLALQRKLMIPDPSVLLIKLLPLNGGC